MNKSEKFWNKMAPNYDKDEKKEQPAYLNIIAKTRKFLKLQDVVLDYGCGTGKLSCDIACHVKHIDGIDSSPKMIEMALKRGKRKKIDNVRFSKMTVFDELLDEESYDVILISYVLHLIENTADVMNRINSLLKPGGILVTITPCLGNKKIMSKLLLILSKVGLVPKINDFKYSDLMQSLKKGDFRIIESECLRKYTQEYYIVAKKN